jgi:hypothetical protein
MAMRKILAAIAVGALALTGTQATAQTRMEKNEARLAEMLEGRVAGEPQACVSAMRSDDIEVIEYVGIIYDAGDTIWVARAKDPRSLGTSDVPIIDRFGSQLCRHDVIRTVDRHSHFTTGAVFLEDFVPYTKQG